MGGMMEWIDTALGIGKDQLNWHEMGLRAIVVFFVSLTYVRIANKRIFGTHSAFDIVLSIMYGSVMSRALTGNSPFYPTLVAGLVLVLLHRLLAVLAYHFGQSLGLSRFIKGGVATLVKDGEIKREVMRKHNVTEKEILEALRTQGGPVEIAKIKLASLERSGNISVVMQQEE